MPLDDVSTAKRSVYRNRRDVERLRAEVFGEEDVERRLKLMAELKAAEDALEASAQELDQLGGDEPSSGRLVSRDEQGGGEADQLGEVMGEGSGGLSYDVELRMSHVPTGVVHLFAASEKPLVTFTFRNGGTDVRKVRVATSVERYSAEAVESVVVAPGGEPVVTHHLVTFFPSEVRSVREMTRASLRLRIEDLISGERIEDSTHPIWLLARNAAYNAIRDPATNELIDLQPYYGAYVTPNAEPVLEVLRTAAGTLDGGIVGYLKGKDAVVAQVRALYDALRATDVRYVNTLVAFGAREGEYMQRVRLPRESLQYKSANCIDATVLMASLLEAASLNPGLVFIPGHAFLAYETAANSDDWDFVETTMFATKDFDEAQSIGRRQRQMWPDAKILSLEALRTEHGVTPMEG